MEKDRPLLPRRIQCLGQSFLVLHDPEAAQRVRMSEGIGRDDRRRLTQAAGADIFQQGFRCLGGEMVGQG
jgi:predicted ATPase